MILSPYKTDACFWYYNEITSRVVAKSGNEGDRFHLGKIIYQELKSAPDFILQIDGATGQSESSGSVLHRSVGCALALRNLGIDQCANIVIMGPNHLDLCIPFYAGLYLGLGLGCIDMNLSIGELRDHFLCEFPKAVFCQSEKAADVAAAIRDANLDCHIITFNEGGPYKSLSRLIQEIDAISIENFQPNDFNTEETLALLVATSGTTGLSKAAEITHKNLGIVLAHGWLYFTKFPQPTSIYMLSSPIQWLSAIHVYIQTPIMKITRLQSSLSMTVEHAYELINKYRPTLTIFNPNMLTSMLKPDTRDSCDFTCFEAMHFGGSAVPQSLLDTLKIVAPNTKVSVGYGMSEISGPCFFNANQTPNSCGQIVGCILVRLVNTLTEKDVIETANVPGELWVKGPSLFKGYCNNPTLTKEVFSDDGWFKTGDIFYRDENWNFYFVDRIKMLLKYRNQQVSPVEIEEVIRRHPGVFEVAVTGIPHPEDGELPVACIIKHTNSDVTPKDIEDLVADTLSDSKRLRGGVIFMKELPLTASSKINRSKLKQLVLKYLDDRAL